MGKQIASSPLMSGANIPFYINPLF